MTPQTGPHRPLSLRLTQGLHVECSGDAVSQWCMWQLKIEMAHGGQDENIPRADYQFI